MIKFLAMDVDGTLTDGKIYMGISGESFKAFDIKDGCGIKEVLPKHDIIPIIITARASKILENRCNELGIKELHQGVRQKLEKLLSVINNYNSQNATTYDLSNCAYIGDDLLDLRCMIPISKAGGIVGCPNDAIDEVKKAADFISSKKCGEGAVRDFINFLIKDNQKDSDKISEKVQFAIDYVNSLDFNNIELGTYSIDNGIYYIVKEYDTKPVEECRLESHKRYIDIQWMISGLEEIQTSSTEKLRLAKDYNSENDVMFWEPPKHMCRCILSDNSYIVLYPNDAHMPGIMVNKPQKLKKIIIKVPT